jgi:hypothetical protein
MSTLRLDQYDEYVAKQTPFFSAAMMRKPQEGLSPEKFAKMDVVRSTSLIIGS